MRKPILSFLLLLASPLAFAQVGIGTTSPNNHAVLDLRSPGNNQGLLVPSLSTTQRTAATLTGSLGAQDNGLLVYDSDDKRFYYWMDVNWQPVLSGSVSGGGTVVDVDTGTGLTGGPISSAGVISLANTSVISGTYGSPSSVGQFTVDAQGRITNASSVAISGIAPSGTAGGDLSGTFPNPSVASLRGSALSATAPAINQVLKWNGSAWTPAADANSGGTITNVATGTGLSGGPITATGTISLANTAVTAGTYGDATHVSQVAVDAQGRITNASSVTITGAAPTGAAGGDLTGNYPNPTIAAGAVNSSKMAVGDYSSKINTGTYAISIAGNATTATTATNFSGSLGGDVTGSQAATTVARLQGSAVSATAPTSNQILKWSGTAWAPAADANSGGTITNIATGTGLSGGPITATGTISLANTAVTAATYGDATHVSQIAVDAQGRITNASSVTITGAAPTGAAGGDLTGNYPNPTIAANAVSASKIAAGDYSTKINTGTYSIGISGNAATATTATNFSGSLGGDVTGSQGATTVAKLQGSAVSATAPATNQILKWTGTAWAPAADANSGGTITNIATGTGLSGGPITATGTIALANTAVTAGTYGSGTQVPQIVVDAQGRLTNATSVTITGAPPTGTAGGDLTGTFPNPTVAASAITSAKILDGTIIDADVSTTAAIVDSKLNTISTPGKVSGNAITSGTIGGSTSINSTGSINIAYNSSTTAVAFANSTATSSSVVKATSAGTGYAFEADQNGTTGSAFGAYINSASNAGNGIYGYSVGTGYSIAGVAAGSGIGVYGTNNTTKYNSYGYMGGTSYGVYGTNQDYAVYGLNSNTGETGWIGGGGYGVYGLGFTAGVYGTTVNNAGYGVYGNNASTLTGATGVYGTSASTGGYGVYGNNTSAGSAAGVYGTSSGTAAYGVLGSGVGARSIGVYGTGVRYGVQGYANNGDGVYGDGGTSGIGVQGIVNGNGYGGYFSSVSGYGIYATCTTQDAGHFVGSVTITNGLNVTGGTKNFKIDHPLDPANKYLYHASIESSQVMNLYTGTVMLDNKGKAIVTLPDWFDALNKDFQYQLTCVGGYANVYIAEEISGNKFKIAGGRKGLKVSWQVTGVRNDEYMKHHPFQAEVEKEGTERGKYLNPVEHGVDEALGLNYPPPVSASLGNATGKP